MKFRFSIHPDDEFPYFCEMEMTESDLKLSREQFTQKYLAPVAGCLLAAFEEPWPTEPEKVIAMLERGGPERALKFYRIKELYGTPS